MELLEEERPRRDPATRVYRSSPLANLAALVVFAGAFGAAGWFVLRDAGDFPWFVWVVGAPFALLFGGVMALVLSALAGGVCASLRPTNWQARTGARGLELNLRSYLNARPGEPLPVLRLEPAQVRSMRRVAERWTTRCGGETTRHMRRWLELDLGDADTGPLEAALVAERGREPAESSFLGIRSTTKHHHEPVRVPESGKVWLEWRRRLFDDLARTIATDDPIEFDRDLEHESGDVLAHARSLARVGSRLEAVELLARELELDLDDARRRLDALDREAA